MSSASNLDRQRPAPDPSNRLPRRSLARLCWLLLLAASGWACSPAPSHKEISLRFIEEDPGDLLNPSRLQTQTSALEWSFLDRQVPDPWRPRGTVQKASDGLQLSSEKAQLQAKIALDPQEIQALKVEFEPTTSHAAFLFWSDAEKPFGTERKIRCKIEPGARSCTFDLAGHARWRGKIERLRLSFNFRQAGTVTLRAIEAMSWAIDPEALPSLLGQPVKVDLANDVRNVLLSVPGFEIQRTLTIPKRASLHFAIGILWNLGASTAFEVAISAGDGEEILYSNEMPDGAAAARSWQEVAIDLQAYAGKEAEITLRTLADVDPKNLRGLPLWANPEIIGASEPRQRPNVVLISIDTLRADHMSLYGYERETTPNLQKWIRESGVAFGNAVAQASWTLPSHTSMLTGISALRHGVNHNSPAPLSLELLSELLHREGYRTLATTGGAYLHPAYRLSQGFDRFEYWPGKGDGPVADSEMEHLLDRAVGWLEESRDVPFFLFFHTYEVHHRTTPREPYFSAISSLEMPEEVRFVAPKPKVEEGFKKSRRYEIGGKEPGALPADLARLPNDIYDSRITYMDHTLQRLLGKIEELGLADETLIVLTSDHGELLGEHGLFGHLSLYDENLIVPLLIAGPEIPAREEPLPTQVRSIDIVPTILDYVGLETPSEVEGLSLRQLIETGEERVAREAWSYASVSNFGLSLRYANRLKLIFNNAVWEPLRGETEVYHLNEDPQEQAPAPTDSEEAANLKNRLAAHYLDTVPGLRLRFDNPTETDLRLLLQGSILRIAGVKSVDLSCDCAVWDRNRIRLEIPAGLSATLVLEDIKSQDTELRVSRLDKSDDDRWSQKIDLQSLATEPETYALTRSGWADSESSSSNDSDPTLQVWSQGPRQMEEVPEDNDDELRDRLKALGYID